MSKRRRRCWRQLARRVWPGGGNRYGGRRVAFSCGRRVGRQSYRQHRSTVKRPASTAYACTRDYVERACMCICVYCWCTGASARVCTAGDKVIDCPCLWSPRTVGGEGEKRDSRARRSVRPTTDGRTSRGSFRVLGSRGGACRARGQTWTARDRRTARVPLFRRRDRGRCRNRSTTVGGTTPAGIVGRARS